MFHSATVPSSPESNSTALLQNTRNNWIFTVFSVWLLDSWWTLPDLRYLVDFWWICSQPPLLFLSPGRCASCGENVVGEGTGCTAMDQVFHVDCFVCMTCSTKLRGKPFFAVEKKAYCEPCYIVSNFFFFCPSSLPASRSGFGSVWLFVCPCFKRALYDISDGHVGARNGQTFPLQSTTFHFIIAWQVATHHTHLHFLFFFVFVLFFVTKWNCLSIILTESCFLQVEVQRHGIC